MAYNLIPRECDGAVRQRNSLPPIPSISGLDGRHVDLVCSRRFTIYPSSLDFNDTHLGLCINLFRNFSPCASDHDRSWYDLAVAIEPLFTLIVVGCRRCTFKEFYSYVQNFIKYLSHK